MNESRILDACINRSAEGLRVLEDIARFSFDHQKMSSDIRRLRHEIRNLFRGREKELLSSRNTLNDVGIATSLKQKQDARKNLKDTVLSNFKRVEEALRSMEEILKSRGEYLAGKKMENLRFSVYFLEPEFVSFFSRKLPQGIYGILGERFSLGRTNADTAKQMVGAGIDVLQYREKLKDKSLKQIFKECCEIREITAAANVPFIINDYADIAMTVGADGIHLGQEDIPIDSIRKIAPEMMIGCSTHSPEQAEKAVADGADYIGVGPIFATLTKDDVCDAVGLEYLEHVAATHDIPLVAIGGIKISNLREVLSRGAKTVCLVTEIIGAENIEKRIMEIKCILGEFK